MVSENASVMVPGGGGLIKLPDKSGEFPGISPYLFYVVP